MYVRCKSRYTARKKETLHLHVTSIILHGNFRYKFWHTEMLVVQVRILGEHTDHEPEEIEKTISRPKYFDPYQAVDYGIIDRVS